MNENNIISVKIFENFRKLEIRELMPIFISDFYFSVQSLSTSWFCNSLIIKLKIVKKKYFSQNGLQQADNQQDFFPCKRVGKKHTDNQVQYSEFVNALGLNKNSTAFTFLIFYFYFSVQSLTTFGICNTLIISMKKARKKIKFFIDMQLPDYQAQFLGLTTFDNVLRNHKL